ncbi:hypothetical protein AXI76_gp189 [Pseudoalteromonas phage H101]|uniref:Uncharacterized protein n=1 Tax=Pseudoalteromonas phage H101 TaxID=1654919 RepID=A0A0H4J2C1_9CAUD|nr:hypothetical protein AXI76_gp189 [Pseudoalteromonas phage H101]AKO61090.1 hypothetical protein [Pseudoalteromonas phage H101]
MNFEWWSIPVTMLLFFIIRGITRTISYRSIVKTSYDEDVPVLIGLKGFFWMVYSPKKYDIEKDYNWLKVKADIKKGVPEQLALLREKVIALEMLQYEYENYQYVDLVWKDKQNEDQSLVVDLDEYTSYNSQTMIAMEEDFIIQQDFINLLESMKELEGDENDEDL